MRSVASLERGIRLLAQQQKAVAADNAPQLVDDRADLRLWNVLQNSKDKARVEAGRVGRKAPQCFDGTEFDRGLQRPGDCQQSWFSFEADDAFGELGEDGRQTAESATDVARRRRTGSGNHARTQFADVALLEIGAQHRPRSVNVNDLPGSPNQTLHLREV